MIWKKHCVIVMKIRKVLKLFHLLVGIINHEGIIAFSSSSDARILAFTDGKVVNIAIREETAFRYTIMETINGNALNLKLSNDGSKLVIQDEEKLTVFLGERSQEFKTKTSIFAISNSRFAYASSSRTQVAFYSLDDEKLEKSLTKEKKIIIGGEMIGNERIDRVEISPDGEYAALRTMSSEGMKSNAIYYCKIEDKDVRRRHAFMGESVRVFGFGQKSELYVETDKGVHIIYARGDTEKESRIKNIVRMSKKGTGIIEYDKEKLRIWDIRG